MEYVTRRILFFAVVLRFYTDADAVCIRPIITEPGLLISPDQDVYEEMALIILYCDPVLYLLHEGPAFSFCMSGVWVEDPTIAVCHEACNPPPTDPDVEHTAEGTGLSEPEYYFHGAVVEYTCLDDLGVLNGIPTTTCRDGVWDPPDLPVCWDSCVSPDNVFQTGSYSHGTWAFFTCLPGMISNGVSWVQCLDEEWSDTVLCSEPIPTTALPTEAQSTTYSPTTCLEPNFPKDVVYIDPVQQLGYRDFDVVYFHCNETVNYVAYVAICYNGSWVPTVPEKICHDPCLVPMVEGLNYTLVAGLTNGTIYTHGSDISFTCKSTGDIRTSSTCDDGSWEPSVDCPVHTTLKSATTSDLLTKEFTQESPTSLPPTPSRTEHTTERTTHIPSITLTPSTSLIPTYSLTSLWDATSEDTDTLLPHASMSTFYTTHRDQTKTESLGTETSSPETNAGFTSTIAPISEIPTTRMRSTVTLIPNDPSESSSLITDGNLWGTTSVDFDTDRSFSRSTSFPTIYASVVSTPSAMASTTVEITPTDASTFEEKTTLPDATTSNIPTSLFSTDNMITEISSTIMTHIMTSTTEPPQDPSTTSSVLWTRRAGTTSPQMLTTASENAPPELSNITTETSLTLETTAKLLPTPDTTNNVITRIKSTHTTPYILSTRGDEISEGPLSSSLRTSTDEDSTDVETSSRSRTLPSGIDSTTLGDVVTSAIATAAGDTPVTPFDPLSKSQITSARTTDAMSSRMSSLNTESKHLTIPTLEKMISTPTRKTEMPADDSTKELTPVTDTTEDDKNSDPKHVSTSPVRTSQDFTETWTHPGRTSHSVAMTEASSTFSTTGTPRITSVPSSTQSSVVPLTHNDLSTFGPTDTITTRTDGQVEISDSSFGPATAALKSSPAEITLTKTGWPTSNELVTTPTQDTKAFTTDVIIDGSHTNINPTFQYNRGADNNLSWWIYVLIVGATAIVLAVIAFILYKKRKGNDQIHKSKDIPPEVFGHAAAPDLGFDRGSETVVDGLELQAK